MCLCVCMCVVRRCVFVCIHVCIWYTLGISASACMFMGRSRWVSKSLPSQGLKQGFSLNLLLTDSACRASLEEKGYLRIIVWPHFLPTLLPVLLWYKEVRRHSYSCKHDRPAYCHAFLSKKDCIPQDVSQNKCFLSRHCFFTCFWPKLWEK